MKSCYFYLLLHPSEREVAFGQIALEVGKGFLHEILHSERQFFGDARRQAESIDAAVDSDPGGVDGGRGVDKVERFVDKSLHHLVQAQGGQARKSLGMGGITVSYAQA